MPLSYRKHRPATQNNRDTGGVLPQKAKQPGRSPESGIATRKPQGGSPRVAAPRVESPPGSPKEGLPSEALAQEGAGLQSSGTARKRPQPASAAAPSAAHDEIRPKGGRDALRQNRFRLERVAGECFQQFTSNSNRTVFRLELRGSRAAGRSRIPYASQRCPVRVSF